MNRYYKILTGALALATVSMSLAQGGPGGPGGGPGGPGGGRRMGGFGGGFGGGGRGGGSMFLLMNPEVQKDINLTQDQKDKLAKLQADRDSMMGGGRRRGGFGGGQGGPGGAGGGANSGPRTGGGGQGQPPKSGSGQAGPRGGGMGMGDRDAMMKRMQEAQNKIDAILTPAQKSRLEQLSIQQRGNMAVYDPDVSKKLGITAAQKKSLDSLRLKSREANQALMQKMQDGEADIDTLRPIMEKNRKTLTTEIDKVLTASQKSKFKEMQGKPFSGNLRPQFGGGGGRGRGGGNRPPAGSA